ncbi:IS481 family transposase, partial [Nocardioides sp. GCM10030258]
MELRLQLIRDGLDAGPVTIAWHLAERGHRAPSTSTIRRILHNAGLIDPEPRKRPRSSYHR